jgi:hypothetical protein
MILRGVIDRHAAILPKPEDCHTCQKIQHSLASELSPTLPASGEGRRESDKFPGIQLFD